MDPFQETARLTCCYAGDGSVNKGPRSTEPGDARPARGGVGLLKLVCADMPGSIANMPLEDASGGRSIGVRGNGDNSKSKSV